MEMLAVALIDRYADLQRILHAADREEEILLQLRLTEEKLHVLGVDTEQLKI